MVTLNGNLVLSTEILPTLVPGRLFDFNSVLVQAMDLGQTAEKSLPKLMLTGFQDTTRHDL